MAFKYDIVKVQELLQRYIDLIKDEVSYNMLIAGGGDCPYVWIEVAISKTNGKVTEDDVVVFGIGDDFDCPGSGGKLYFNKQDLDTFKVTEEILEEKKTEKAVKEFMLRIIKREVELKETVSA